MSFGTAAAPQKKTTVADMVSSATRRRASVREDDSPDVTGNSFHKIIFDEKMSPTEKKRAIAEALVFSGTKEQNKARIAEFEQFKEFLQANREKMASEVIALTNTEAFSQLKVVYEEMNGSLIDFEQKMKPLTDILEAVYSLRSSGTTLDVFRSIGEDRKREEELIAKLNAAAAEEQDCEDTLVNLSYEIASLAEQKSFFGFGGVKEEARQAIAVKSAEAEAIKARLSDIRTRKDSIRAELDSVSSTGEFAAEKSQLKKLLDISSDEHRESQKSLVAAAQNFVSTSKDRIGEVRVHLSDMTSKIENLEDTNGTLTRVYAVLNEGVKEAAKKNSEIKAGFDAAPEEEDLISKMKREEDKMAVEDHLKVLNSSAADTLKSYSDLTAESIRIKSMRDNNQDQVNQAKEMHVQGVAGVASQLSVVLQAVSQAALGESSEMAKATLLSMSDHTNDIAKKEVIRTALGVGAQSEAVQRAVEDLASYGDVVIKAREITKDGLDSMRAAMDQLEQTAADVQEEIKKTSSVSSGGEVSSKKQRVSSGLGKV